MTLTPVSCWPAAKLRARVWVAYPLALAVRVRLSGVGRLARLNVPTDPAVVTLTVLTVVAPSERLMVAPPSGPALPDTSPATEPSPLWSMTVNPPRGWPPSRSTIWTVGAYPGLVRTSW